MRFHARRAVLGSMSGDRKTKQHQNKYFTSPGKLTRKPLLHTTVCKVQSTHQAQTKPWSHTLLGQKPHRIHPGTAVSKGKFVRARLAPIQETSSCSPTFTPVSISQALLLAFVGEHPQIQHDNIRAGFFSISCQTHTRWWFSLQAAFIVLPSPL